MKKQIAYILNSLLHFFYMYHNQSPREIIQRISMESIAQLFSNTKIYSAVIFMQISYAFMSIIAKSALNHGLSQHVLVAYRMVVAATLIAPFAIVFERTTRPKMTLSVFAKIVLLSLFEPVLSQNLYFTGMKYTTPNFTVAMCNILPAMTFIMACIFRFEKINIKKLHSQAKIVGTIVTVGGAMMMTFLKGNVIELPWSKVREIHNNQSTSVTQKQDHIKGAMMITVGCFCWSCFIILQAVILKSYPAGLSLTTLICMISSVEAMILAFAIERGNTTIWSLHLDVKLLAVVYGGMVSCTAYFIMGWLMKKKGPVFVSAFNPLGMVILAILSSFLLAEEMYLFRVFGAIVILFGLYMVLWGRSNDLTASKLNNNMEAQTDDQELATISGGDTGIPIPGSEFIAVAGVDIRMRPAEEEECNHANTNGKDFV